MSTLMPDEVMLVALQNNAELGAPDERYYHVMLNKLYHGEEDWYTTMTFDAMTEKYMLCSFGELPSYHPVITWDDLPESIKAHVAKFVRKAYHARVKESRGHGTQTTSAIS